MPLYTNCMAKVVLPVPGAPSTRLAEPRSRPPHIMESSDSMPVGQRSSFMERPPCSGTEPAHHRLLHVQAVLGFVECHAARPVERLVGDLLAAVGGQAVGDERVGRGAAEQLGVELEAAEC